MKTNMGAIDRVLRVLVALVVVTLYFTDVITGGLAIVLLILSGIFILTSIVGTCPLYMPFGIKTCKMKNK